MKKVFVLILSLIMIFSVSGETFATDSYSNYFSEEREFTVVDNALDYSTYLYSDEETGYLYSRNVDTKEERLIYDKNVTNHYVWNGSIYCVVDGNSIVKIAADGSNPETVLTTEKNIDRLYVNDDLIFYQMDNAIYRYYIESGVTDCIVEADYIYFFYPYSNFVVEWGVGDNIVYRVDTSAVNSVYGTGTANTTTLDEYTFIEEIDANSVSSSSTSVHGKTIPLTDYPNGSYFTKTGNACKKETNGGCHNDTTEACKYERGSCPNCMFYPHKRAVQCMAFAHYLYKQIWGVEVSDKDTTTASTSTGAKSRNFFWSISSGTELRVKLKGKIYEHSIVVVDISRTGVTIYHANGSGKCQVEYQTLTFESFANKYDTIVSKYNNRHSFKTTYTFDEDTHWHPCQFSGCNGKNSIEYHSFIPNSHGKIICSVCKYVQGLSQNSLNENNIK